MSASGRAGPDSADGLCDLGTQLLELGRTEEALASCDRALALDPNHAAVLNNRGIALHRLGRHEAALASYAGALAISPAFSNAIGNRACVLHEMGRSGEALSDCQRVVALEPDSFRARLTACIACIPAHYDDESQIADARGRYSDCLRELTEFCRTNLSRAVNTAGRPLSAVAPFLLAYQGLDDRDLQASLGDLLCAVMNGWACRHKPTARKRSGVQRRLRVGIVSTHFRRHSVWDVLTRGIVTGLSRSRFELLGYHLGVVEDSETARARATFESFHGGPRTLSQWVDVVRSDSPDVLLYPELGMDISTVQLAALRLAPVQAALWGHPVTSGLPTMDYFISGQLLESPVGERHYTERLVKLPNLGCRFTPFTVEDTDPPEDAFGFPMDRSMVRFLSCQQSMKYLPQHDSIYPRIAKRWNKCCFVFVRFENKAELFEKFWRRLRRAFAAEDLDADRYCRVVEFQPRDRFFALLRKADIYLDCISFSGFTTALQAVQCGLPIVAMEGEHLKNRLASAVLRRLGMAETIARSVDEYIDIAVNLAKDKELRARLRKNMDANRRLILEDPAPIRALEEFLESAVGGARSNSTQLSGENEPAESPANRSLAALKASVIDSLGPNRLENIHLCLETIRREGIQGDFVDTGPRQGAAASYLRAYLTVHGMADRILWVADTAQSMGKLLALLRIEGGLYEDTMGALEAFHQRVVPGGFVIVDGCSDATPGRRAVELFRQRKGMREIMIPIDRSAVFWRIN